MSIGTYGLSAHTLHAGNNMRSGPHNRITPAQLRRMCTGTDKPRNLQGVSSIYCIKDHETSCSQWSERLGTRKSLTAPSN